MSKPPRSSSKGNRPPASLPGSVGEALDEVEFQPIGRQIAAGQKKIPKNPLGSTDWAGPAIEFLQFTLPRTPTGNWEHLYIAAYEVACQALEALGHAVVVDGGAIPVSMPILPAVLPRWDDLATTVVCAASQSRLLQYRKLWETGSAKGPKGPKGRRRPNIRAGYGCPPAFLAGKAFSVFQALGLILDCRWTPAAETILWRDSPYEAGMNFAKDHRFIEALDAALTSLPEDIAATIKDIATMPTLEAAGLGEFAEQYASLHTTKDEALSFFQERSRRLLGELFAKRWRLRDGWLSVDECKRTLFLQLDPLAIAMRGEFAARYLPEFPFLHGPNV